ncbi:hypothetical protein EV188_103579 [Actinomycetospora succinea]|uniref:Uncharacterized protein n=1 Tax=Actinomycetospora succinea TaxID=663603 RepID=A0A4R6VE93_9PSEU|nr:hypothetical protein [Actinomycetospora succinea]TDQ61072.1 hypothetical protein EV188_103579 [Actinomycetospora succinea]
MSIIATAVPTPWSRGRRRDQEWADIHFREHEVRTLWRAAAVRGGLGEKILSPTGTVWAVPDVTAVHLGPPLRFTIRLRPAQIWEDATSAGRHMANALGVENVRFTQLAPGWIEIQAPAGPIGPDEPVQDAADATPELPPRPTRPLSPAVERALARGHRKPTRR